MLHPPFSSTHKPSVAPYASPALSTFSGTSVLRRSYAGGPALSLPAAGSPYALRKGPLLGHRSATARRKSFPLSPTLPTAYASPLLHAAQSWQHGPLPLRVGDGSMLATGSAHHPASDRCALGFSEAASRLSRNGPAADSDKTGLPSFCLKRSLHAGVARPPAALPLPGGGTLVARWPHTTRCLGTFLSEPFSWTRHAKATEARPRPTALALQALGSLFYGLGFASWQKVFRATALPALTGGSPLWLDSIPRPVLNVLRVAQNDGARCTGGAFRTTLTAPQHCTLATPPAKYAVAKRRHQAQLGLSHLAPLHKL